MQVPMMGVVNHPPNYVRDGHADQYPQLEKAVIVEPENAP